MERIGSVADFAVLKEIYRAVMEHRAFAQINGTTVFTRRFAGGTIFGMDYQNRRYIEQNPKTSSQYAVRARRGEKIMWCISLTEDAYLGRVDEGIVYATSLIAAAHQHTNQKETT